METPTEFKECKNCPDPITWTEDNRFGQPQYMHYRPATEDRGPMWLLHCPCPYVKLVAEPVDG